ncbi:MAG: hypothetical protein S0880_20615 [Actinomycetota bacterium]|nr:hypothetical protein [Actinomycetota bacterium]
MTASHRLETVVSAAVLATALLTAACAGPSEGSRSATDAPLATTTSSDVAAPDGFDGRLPSESDLPPTPLDPIAACYIVSHKAGASPVTPEHPCE